MDRSERIVKKVTQSLYTYELIDAIGVANGLTYSETVAFMALKIRDTGSIPGFPPPSADIETVFDNDNK